MAKFRQPPFSVAEANIISKSITANGTYNASSDSADGYNPVSVNVDHVGIVYAGTTAPDNSIGSDNDIYIQYEYNSSFPYDYKIIAEYRKISGAWTTYADTGIYLPYTDSKDIICEAFPDIFDSQLSTWGVGTNPIIFSGTPSYNSGENAISIPTASNNVLAYCDLGSNGTPFTAYVVMKGVSMSSYSRLLSAMASRSSGQGILLYGNPVTVSSWGSDTGTSVPGNDYFVGVLQYSSLNNALGGVYGSSLITKALANSGRYITIGRTDIDPNTTNAEPCDTLVKYIGIVKGADSINAINANIAHLYNTFIA